MSFAISRKSFLIFKKFANQFLIAHCSFKSVVLQYSVRVSCTAKSYSLFFAMSFYLTFKGEIFNFISRLIADQI